MINTTEFIKRLENVIDYYGESASSFAETIGVQRSSISHILSGRNKPSLDFVLKVLSAYPDVNLYWLCNGTGSFISEKIIQPNTKESSNPTFENELTKTQNTNTDKSIEQIIVFYSDGTFKNFKN